MSDERLKRIEDKVDKIVDQIGYVNVTLAKQHISLELHIKRTNLLEAKLDPIEKHVTMIQGITKFVAQVAAVAAALAAIIAAIVALK